MTLADWVLVANLAAVAIGGIAILITIAGLREQPQTSTFLEYTKRYSETMSVLPFDARTPGADLHLADLLADARMKVLTAYRDYFNLCWEEMWLFQMRRIDVATWREWTESMADTMTFPCAGEAWDVLRREYGPDSEFSKFFELVANGTYVVRTTRLSSGAASVRSRWVELFQKPVIGNTNADL